jgi:hypothetical protein
LYNNLKLHPKYTTSLKATITRYYKNMEKLKDVLRNSEKHSINQNTANDGNMLL